jgi:protein-S-isoprenylcysteine O-methyltransferase Ste14
VTSSRRTGWLFVTVQVVLLVTLVALPTGTDWHHSTWMSAVSTILLFAGAGIALVGMGHLGPSLTATPEPKHGASLRTGGLYRYARHPIYTGVLLVAAGLVLRSRSFVTLTVGVVTLAFFNGKAAWEERRLAATYDDYAEYSARTGRFAPRPRRRISP